MILHICARGEWKSAGAQYGAELLAGTGFLHCSDPGTVHLPANRLFAGRTDLVLLEIDLERLDAPVRWEPGEPEGPAGPWFPHVYGTIRHDAVVAVHPFAEREGKFALPDALASR